MSVATGREAGAPLAEIPEELRALRARVASLPADLRVALEPVVGEALEQAVYRGRVLAIAREALERFRHDLEVARFDLEATRREREEFRRRLEGV